MPLPSDSREGDQNSYQKDPSLRTIRSTQSAENAQNPPIRKVSPARRRDKDGWVAGAAARPGVPCMGEVILASKSEPSRSTIGRLQNGLKRLAAATLVASVLWLWSQVAVQTLAPPRDQPMWLAASVIWSLGVGGATLLLGGPKAPRWSRAASLGALVGVGCLVATVSLLTFGQPSKSTGNFKQRALFVAAPLSALAGGCIGFVVYLWRRPSPVVVGDDPDATAAADQAARSAEGG